jgi:hypothetical protein
MGLEKKGAGAGENGVVAITLSVNWWEKNIRVEQGFLWYLQIKSILFPSLRMIQNVQKIEREPLQ